MVICFEFCSQLKCIIWYYFVQSLKLFFWMKYLKTDVKLLQRQVIHEIYKTFWPWNLENCEEGKKCGQCYCDPPEMRVRVGGRQWGGRAVNLPLYSLTNSKTLLRTRYLGCCVSHAIIIWLLYKTAVAT